MAAAAGHSSLLSVERGPVGTLRVPLPDTMQRRHALGRRRVPLRKRVTLQTVRVQNRVGARRGNVKAKEEEEIEAEDLGSGTRKVKLPGTMKLQGPQSKDNKVVFVAGATGRVGSRTVRELLRLGFRVRASTRNVEKAEALFEDVLQNIASEDEPKPASPFALFSPAKLFGFLKPKPGKQLDIVDCDLESPEAIEVALGNAGVVVCCIGASEKEVLDVTGPYRIDFKATKNLIDAASEAQVNHFVLLTSLGTQKFGFPAAVLNLFWGVLVWKAKAEKALIASGLPYTIVRPGGMERPTDTYKETHNLLLAEADTLFGGQVSSLQVAELIACTIDNLQLSKNKILEVVAETTAPLRPIEELLKEIPSTVEEESAQIEKPSVSKTRPQRVDLGTQRLFKKQEEQKVAEEKQMQAQKAEEEKRKLEALKVKYEKEIVAAKEKEEEARNAAEVALAEKAELEKRASEIRAKSEAAALAARQAKALEAAILAAARKGQVLSELEKEKILESVKPEAVKTSKEIKAPAKESRLKLPFFGKGKIQQEEKLTPTAQLAEDKQLLKEKKLEAEAKKVEEQLEGARIAEAKQKEELEKAKKEKRKQAEQEAAVRTAAAAEAKKKEEQEKAEAEAQIAAEAKKKEDQEKAEAEAKKKEEKEKAEAEAQIAAEAKKKEEQEKAEVEAQRVAAEEEAAKVEESKRKQEQEKSEAEAKLAGKREKQSNQDQDEESVTSQTNVETLKTTVTKEAVTEMDQTEDNMKEEPTEEEEARNKLVQKIIEREKVALEKAKSATSFVWPWQKPKTTTEEPIETSPAVGFDVGSRSTPPVLDEVVNKDTETIPDTETLPASSRPLSPYAMFPGLKPPSSPTPSPPVAETVETPPPEDSLKQVSLEEPVESGKLATSEKVVADEIEDEEDLEARMLLAREVAQREREALEKAKAATSFAWPWQKPQKEEGFVDPTAGSEFEKDLAMPPAPLSETERPEKQALPPCPRPLSPYSQFPGLKPPTSPLPSPPPPPPPPPRTAEIKVEGPLSQESSNPLSPYSKYPGLKPPGTPAPLAGNGAMAKESEVCPADEDRIAETASTNSGFRWPWQ